MIVIVSIRFVSDTLKMGIGRLDKHLYKYAYSKNDLMIAFQKTCKIYLKNMFLYFFVKATFIHRPVMGK